MKRSPYPAPPACSDLRLGALATQQLGRTMSPTVKAHVAACAACRIQRAAFERLDEGPVAPAAELRVRLQQAVRERLPGRG